MALRAKELSGGRTCIKCGHQGPESDFYCRRNICKACCKKKVRAWEISNPRKRAAIVRRYQSSSPVHKATRRRWRNQRWVKETERVHNHKYVSQMRTPYLRKLLKAKGITDPHPLQIERQRQRCLAIRRRNAVLRGHRPLTILLSCASLTKK